MIPKKSLLLGLVVLVLLVILVEFAQMHREQPRVTHWQPFYRKDTSGPSKPTEATAVYNQWMKKPRGSSAISGIVPKLTRVRGFSEVLELQPARHQSGKFSNWKDLPQCKKWVVVTTISSVTKTLTQLQSLADWCLVVVGDKKSPKDFHLNGPRSLYLDAEAQKQLGYESIKHTPWSSFSRKNIGYLFALQQGAQFIYDTDDDNELLSSTLDISFTKSISPLQARVRGLVWNPYPFFGFKEGWPRGLPLDQVMRRPISASPANNSQWNPIKEFTCTNNSPPQNNLTHLGGAVGGVWQFVVRGDTDVDAIYRLTRGIPFADFKTSGDVVSLSPGVMAPYNAQATLHHYDAFWGLLLPASVHGRVSDIWRAYITQRIMWDVGGRLHFAPSQMIVTNRNTHSALEDFSSELPLYLQSGELVKYLQQWNCSKDTLQECLLQMYIDLYEVGLVEVSDVRYMFAWLQDLINMDYRFPALLKSNPIQWRKADWKKIRLCIHFNTEAAIKEKTVQILHREYSKYFDKISFSGPVPKPVFLSDDVQYLHCDIPHVQLQQKCLVAHLETYPDADGYLYTADDAFLDLSRLAKMPHDKVWTIHGTAKDVRQASSFDDKVWPLWSRPESYQALKHYVENLPDGWKDHLKELNGDEHIVHTLGLADVIYVPEGQRSNYIEVAKYFCGQPYIDHEVVTPVIRDLAVGNDYVPFIHGCLWWPDYNFQIQNEQGKSGEHDFMHPLKLSDPSQAALWSQLMDDVETSMV